MYSARIFGDSTKPLKRMSFVCISINLQCARWIMAESYFVFSPVSRTWRCQ